MTALPTAFVQRELRRLHSNEWSCVRECSRAERCSVNRCPLDPLIALRTADPADRETKCPVSKGDRERAFSRLPTELRALLPFGGLYESEWARRETGRRRQASLSPEQREKQRALLAEHRAVPFGPRTSTATNPTTSVSAPDPSGEPSASKAGTTEGEPT